MITTIENNYGCDADGNRGYRAVFHELDYRDEDTIRCQIEEQYESDIKSYTVYVYSDVSDEEIEFEVDITDYFTKEEIEEMDKQYE